MMSTSQNVFDMADVEYSNDGFGSKNLSYKDRVEVHIKTPPKITFDDVKQTAKSML